MSGESEDENVGFLYRAMRNRDPKKRRVKPVSRHLLQVNFGGEDSDEDSDYEVKHSDLSDDDEVNLLLNQGKTSNTAKSSPEPAASDDDDEIGSDDDSDSSDDREDDDDDDDDEGSDDSDDNGPKKNYFDINIDDSDDDEDYVPKKLKGRNKRVEKHAEKLRIRSPEAVQRLEEPTDNTESCPPMKVLICCVCLGDISETDDEIVECDNCGVAVHEGCYGISDTQSVASTESSASTEPWFCDACKAGVKPDCELCPNEGGIFKETDAGKWVHLVCALYTPGVAFGDVDKLSPVTLFEMPYSKWGLKECSLCEDSRFSRTGVCVSCDAGMCRSFFHVTCAQRNGLLSEASPDEDIADPFYAYCKLHADKITSRAKRRNYLAIQSHVRQHANNNDKNDEKEKARFRRKLVKHRQKYNILKAERPPSWVPPQKLVRFLTSSPSVVKKMLRKAELMGIITQSTHVVHTAEKQERKKSNIYQPAFTAEYVTYYLDRNVRIEKMKTDLKELEKQNEKLRIQDNALRKQYDKLVKESEKTEDPGDKLREQGTQLYTILDALSKKSMPVPEMFKQKKTVKAPKKKEVLQSSSSKVINQCGKCLKSHDQHLLAKCDKCHLWYHLACLDPPLTRMPKKTSRWGWQCSDCAKSSSEESEDSTNVNVNAPRRLRDKINQPAKFSRAQEDMDFLFPKKIRRRDRGKKSLHRKALNKKTPRTKKTTPPPEQEPSEKHEDETKADEDDDVEEATNDAVSLSPDDIPPSPAMSTVDVSMEDEEEGSPVNFASPEDVASPSVVDISDEESSMEVEIKIVEETTPIYKQHAFHDVSRTGRKIIKKRHYDDEMEDSDTSPRQPQIMVKRPSPDQSTGKRSMSKTPPEKGFGSQCVTCSKPGDRKNMVSCDSCEQCYHFHCLNPPAKKTPKQRGYNWFCEACDQSDESEEDGS